MLQSSIVERNYPRGYCQTDLEEVVWKVGYSTGEVSGYPVEHQSHRGGTIARLLNGNGDCLREIHRKGIISDGRVGAGSFQQPLLQGFDGSEIACLNRYLIEGDEPTKIGGKSNA